MCRHFLHERRGSHRPADEPAVEPAAGPGASGGRQRRVPRFPDLAPGHRRDDRGGPGGAAATRRWNWSTSPHPTSILMDVRMPTMDGIETTRRLKATHPAIGIVALTGSEDQRAVRDMLVAGASGYVLKDSDGDEILHAIRQAAAGGGVISPEVTPTRDREPHRGPRARTTPDPPVGDRPAGPAGAQRPAPRADLPARSRAPHPGHRDPGHGPDAVEGHRPGGGTRTDPGQPRRSRAQPGPARCNASRPPWRPGSPSGPT